MEKTSGGTSGRGAPFGARLRRLRREAGLTQEELASRVGLTLNAVSAPERGARRHPYPHTVRSLAEALGLVEGERAARLWGAIEAMKEASGMRITPLARSIFDHEARVAAARSRLGEETFAVAWEEGRAMPLGRAVEYALGPD